MQQPFVIAASGKAAAGKGGTPPLPTGSVGGPVRLHHRLRNAPAVAHLVTVLPGPSADRVRLLAVRASGRLGHRRLPPGAASTTGTSAGLTTVLDEGGQGLVELVGVLIRQVDLVGTVVQREGHRPDRIRAIDVVDEPHGRLLCHCALPSMAERLKEPRPILRTMLSIRNFPAKNRRTRYERHARPRLRNRNAFDECPSGS